MTEFLVFQLYGPMASWGDVAVGEYRPTYGHPSKSATLGLIAAALGIRRDQESEQHALADGYGLGVRLDNDGELLRDYHTVQVPPTRRGQHLATRRDELAVNKLATILSQRDYRVDAAYTTALWGQDRPPYTLEQIECALRCPRLSLYLGRKCCPLSLPLHPQRITAATLKEAFDQYHPPEPSFLSPLPVGQARYYWEGLDESAAGLTPTFVYPRRDQALSRARWQFAERDEYYAAQPKEMV